MAVIWTGVGAKDAITSKNSSDLGNVGFPYGVQRLFILKTYEVQYDEWATPANTAAWRRGRFS